MRKTIMIMIIALFIPFLLFADDLSAIGYGLTKAEAEENAYKELSKLIRVSVYNKEMVYEKDINDETNNSEFSMFSLHATEDQFLNSEIDFKINKNFKIDKDNLGVDKYVCTLQLKESSSAYYIDLINNTYIKNIEYLENQYEEKKERISYEASKNFIRDIIKAYQTYNTAKYVLVALNSFSSKIERPKKTISIWQNEYKDLIIKHNNELVKQKADVSSNNNLSDVYIKQKLKEIDLELVKNSLEVDKIIENETQNTLMDFEQKKIKIKNEVTNVLNNILANNYKYNSNANDYYKNTLLFDEYYNQYKKFLNEYYLLLDQSEKNFQDEVDKGIKEIEEKPYLATELDNLGNPISIAKTIRKNKISKFSSQKENEYNINLKIINDKMLPTINIIQNNLLNCLSNINNSSTFSSDLIPDDIIVNLNNDTKEFILDLTFNKSSIFEIVCSLVIPYIQLDQRLDFDNSNENFDISDKKQLATYESYKILLQKYKMLLESKTFLTYRFDFVLNIDLVYDNYYQISIENKINNLTLYRNDLFKQQLNLKKFSFDKSSYKLIYTDFIISNELLDTNYYDNSILNFYNQIKLTENEKQEVLDKLESIKKEKQTIKVKEKKNEEKLGEKSNINKFNMDNFLNSLQSDLQNSLNFMFGFSGKSDENEVGCFFTFSYYYLFNFKYIGLATELSYLSMDELSSKQEEVVHSYISFDILSEFGLQSLLPDNKKSGSYIGVGLGPAFYYDPASDLIQYELLSYITYRFQTQSYEKNTNKEVKSFLEFRFYTIGKRAGSISFSLGVELKSFLQAGRY